jgi:hypothetical protein
MSVIEQSVWTWRRKDDGRIGTCVDRQHAEQLREYPDLFEIEEFVPVSHLRGAVDLLAAIGRAANTYDAIPAEANLLRVPVPLRLVRDARAFGGR